MKIFDIEPVFLLGDAFIPSPLEPGKLYISKHWKTAIHLCACGCEGKTVTPLGVGEWHLIENTGQIVTLEPSIGNFTGEDPYHAHYFIINNKIIWV